MDHYLKKLIIGITFIILLHLSIYFGNYILFVIFFIAFFIVSKFLKINVEISQEFKWYHLLLIFPIIFINLYLSKNQNIYILLSLVSNILILIIYYYHIKYKLKN